MKMISKMKKTLIVHLTQKNTNKHADVIFEHTLGLNSTTYPGKHDLQTFRFIAIITPQQIFNCGLPIFMGKQYLRFFQLLCLLETTTANERSLSLISQYSKLSTNEMLISAARVISI